MNAESCIKNYLIINLFRNSHQKVRRGQNIKAGAHLKILFVCTIESAMWKLTFWQRHFRCNLSFLAIQCSWFCVTTVNLSFLAIQCCWFCVTTVVRSKVSTSFRPQSTFFKITRNWLICAKHVRAVPNFIWIMYFRTWKWPESALIFFEVQLTLYVWKLYQNH